MAKKSVPAAKPAPRVHRPLALFAAVLLAGAALVVRPRPARAQDDDGRWGDGTWSGDEGNWDDQGPRAGDPRDGYAPRDSRDHDRRAQDDGYDRGEGERDDYAPPRSGPSIGEFHESLSPYGEWIDTPEYGTVWRPTAVDDGFRPYYAGHWARTTAGWYWVAEEPFGWAVYHYGRWAYLDSVGWAWLPGQVWAPAWVSWRWGDGYAGWCPLGPRGYVYEAAAAYVIVPQPYFLAPVRHYAVPIVQVPQLIPHTHPLPMVRPGPSAGPVVHAVAQAAGHPVRPLPIADASAPPRNEGGAVSGGVVFAYRPRSIPLGRPVISGASAQPSQQGAGQGGGVRTWGGPVRGGPAALPRGYGDRAGELPQAGRGVDRGPRAAETPLPPAHPYFGGVPVRGIAERNAQAGAPHLQPAPRVEPNAQAGAPRLQPVQHVQAAPHAVGSTYPAVTPPPPAAHVKAK